jgi:hypothetical protein
MQILPILGSNLSAEKGAPKTLSLILKYYGLTVHPTSNMLYVDRNNRKIPAKYKFSETQEKSASSQKVVVRLEYLKLLTAEVR